MYVYLTDKQAIKQKAREVAVKAWCLPETEHITLIPALVEAFADIIVEEWEKK